MAKMIRSCKEGDWIEVEWELTDSYDHIHCQGYQHFMHKYMRRRRNLETGQHQLWSSNDGKLWVLELEE